MTLAKENNPGFHTLRTAVLATNTTCVLASKLPTGTAPETTSVSSKEYAVSTKHFSLQLWNYLKASVSHKI